MFFCSCVVMKKSHISKIRITQLMKTESEKKFDTLVSHVFTFFKPLGYKKKGNNFRLYDKQAEFGKIVNFQKSVYGNKQCISFTINISIYLADYEYHWSKGKRKSGENFAEASCVIRNRIDKFNWHHPIHPQWFDIKEETDFDKLKEEIDFNFVNAISYLDKIKTKKDVLYEIYTNASDLPDSVAKTLFYNGQKNQALNFLEQTIK